MFMAMDGAAHLTLSDDARRAYAALRDREAQSILEAIAALGGRLIPTANATEDRDNHLIIWPSITERPPHSFEQITQLLLRLGSCGVRYIAVVSLPELGGWRFSDLDDIHTIHNDYLPPDEVTAACGRLIQPFLPPPAAEKEQKAQPRVYPPKVFIPQVLS